MIPKTLHYCWFGHNQKSPLIRRCMDSWKRHLPEYEVVAWDESNFDVNMNRYVAVAYDRRKWAFVSDYVRLFALHRDGGIYLDTDVEVRRSLDSFLVHAAFTGFENYKGMLSPITAVLGTAPRHPWISELMHEYDSLDFPPSGAGLDTNTRRITNNLVLKYGVRIEDTKQVVGDDLHIYPSGVFCNYSKDSYTVHHFSGSWIPLRQKVRSRIGDVARALRVRR